MSSTNHVHLLISADHAEAAGALVKAFWDSATCSALIGCTSPQRYLVGRRRFRSCPIQEEAYLLACQRYIELNPVRAAMVAHPGEYRWSSYRANGQGEENALLRPHALYDGLGLDAARRVQAAYRELFVTSWSRAWWMKFAGPPTGNFVLGNGTVRRTWR